MSFAGEHYVLESGISPKEESRPVREKVVDAFLSDEPMETNDLYVKSAEAEMQHIRIDLSPMIGFTAWETMGTGRASPDAIRGISSDQMIIDDYARFDSGKDDDGGS